MAHTHEADTKRKNSLVLYAADIHAPYHDKAAVELLIHFVGKVKPDIIHLGGDIVDFYAVSNYDKDPARKLKLQHELDSARDIMIRLRGAAPDAVFEFREGNHEFRLRRFLNQNAEALSVLTCLSLPSLLCLKDIEAKYIPNKEVYRRGKLFYLHGDEVKAGGAHPAFAIFNKLKSNTILGHFHRAGSHMFRDFGGNVYGAWATGCLCYSDDTDILTQRGFVRFADLKETDRVGCYKPEDKSIRLELPLAYQTLPYHGKMVHFKGDRVDLLVTPEHKMIWQDHQNKIRQCPAQELCTRKGSYAIPLNGFSQEEDQIDLDWARFAAWFVTEGTLDRGNGYPRITIYQKKEPGKSEIEALLTRLGLQFSFYVDTRGGVPRWRLSTESTRIALQHLNLENPKRLSRAVLNSSYRLLEEVYRIMVLADGSIRKDNGSTYYASICPGLVDDFSEVCHKTGRSSKARHKTRDTNHKKNAQINICGVRKARVGSYSSAEESEYSGLVYDVTSPTGFLVVRRNGHVMISGNCDLSPTYAPHNQWSHGFAMIEHAPSGNFQVEQVPIMKKGRVASCMWRGGVYTASAGPNEDH